MRNKFFLFLILNSILFMLLYSVKNYRLEKYLDDKLVDTTTAYKLIYFNIKRNADTILEIFRKDERVLSYINTIFNNSNKSNHLKEDAIVQLNNFVSKGFKSWQENLGFKEFTLTIGSKTILQKDSYNSPISKKIFNGYTFKKNIYNNYKVIATISAKIDFEYFIESVNFSSNKEAFFISKYDKDISQDKEFFKCGMMDGFIKSRASYESIKKLNTLLTKEHKEKMLKNIKSKLSIGDNMTLSLQVAKKPYVFLGSSIKDRDNNIIAYMFVYYEDNMLLTIEDDFFLYWFVMSFLLLLLFFIYIREKNYKEKIQAQLEFRKEVVNSANSGIGLMHHNGVFIEVNKYYANILGYSEAQLIGKSCLDLVNPLDRNRSLQILKQAREQGKVQNIEKECITLDGKSIHLEFSLKKIDNDKFIAVVNSLEDKYKIVESLNEFESIFNNTSIGYMVVDSNRIITNINHTFCKIFGYKDNELKGKSTRILHISDESYTKWGKTMFAQAQQKAIVSIESEMIKKNGVYIWCEISGSPMSGILKGDGVVWSAIDITDKIKNRKILNQQNHELQKNYYFIRQLMDSNPLPIYVKDKHMKYSECNKAFCEFMALEKEAVIGKGVYELFDTKYADEYMSKDLAMQDLNSQFYKTNVINAIGHQKTVEFHKRSLYKDSKFDGILGVIVDVSERENFELILQDRIKEEINKNRAQQELHEESLVQNAKFSAIGQLSAGITHELNTPLTYIKGNFEMLQMDISELEDGLLKDDIKDSLSEIDDGINRLANIVDSMREMAGSSKEIRESVNIYTTLITALTMAYNKSKQITNIKINNRYFDIGFDKNEFQFMSYIQKQRIEQVWIIIINNALDELVKVDDFASRVFDINIYEDNTNIIVEFSDNAGGINDNILDKIFDPFVSGKVSGGMGVGLNVAKKIVDENSGSIEAINYNFGAMFRVSLPKEFNDKGDTIE